MDWADTELRDGGTTFRSLVAMTSHVLFAGNFIGKILRWMKKKPCVSRIKGSTGSVSRVSKYKILRYDIRQDDWIRIIAIQVDYVLI